MSDFTENLIALNTLEHSHDLNGAVPLVMQLEKIDPAAMVSGVTTVEVVSPFGTGKGEVLGVLPLNSIVAANKALAISAAASSTAGSITLTLNSTSSASTTNLAAFYVLIVGRILPTDV